MIHHWDWTTVLLSCRHAQLWQELDGSLTGYSFKLILFEFVGGSGGCFCWNCPVSPTFRAFPWSFEHTSWGSTRNFCDFPSQDLGWDLLQIPVRFGGVGRKKVWRWIFHTHVMRFVRRNLWNLQYAVILAGWWFGTCFIFPHIGLLIIPIDELIFFRGVAQPPTSYSWGTYEPVP